MNLSDLITHVQGYGFAGAGAGAGAGITSDTITRFLNDAQGLIARRVSYFTDEATYSFTTVSQTASYPWPSNLGRLRELVDTNRQMSLKQVLLRDIDNSPNVYGAPTVYAQDAANLHLYPTPDGAYSLSLRYYKLPVALKASGDTPSLPADWHRLLWMWAVAECYAAEDDLQTSDQWKQRFNEALAQFAADVKFISADIAPVLSGMWDEDGIGGRGWGLYT